MKPAKTIITHSFLFLFFLFIYQSSAMADTNLTEQEIVKKANHIALYQGDNMKGRVKMEITDKQGRIRKRVFTILRQDSSGEEDQDQKYFTYFKTPADVRKMVFMVFKHTKSKRDDDRWLYLPGLDLVKRIAGSDKRTSFVGSDFLYEDISGRGIDEDTHKLVKTTDRYYILDNTPKEPSLVEFSHYRVFIDKSSFITRKMEFYKKPNILYRTISVIKVRDIVMTDSHGPKIFPTVVESVAKSMETGTKTTMKLSDVSYNIDLDENIFSERYLRRPPRSITR